MCQTSQVQAVSVVEAVLRFEKRQLKEAINRKFGVFSSKTFYSLHDNWTYKGVYSVAPGHEQCPYCSGFDGRDFNGTMLRRWFPDHLIFDEDTIYVNYHETLWGKDSCKCYLYRVGSAADFKVKV